MMVPRYALQQGRAWSARDGRNGFKDPKRQSRRRRPSYLTQQENVNGISYRKRLSMLPSFCRVSRLICYGRTHTERRDSGPGIGNGHLHQQALHESRSGHLGISNQRIYSSKRHQETEKLGKPVLKESRLHRGRSRWKASLDELHFV